MVLSPDANVHHIAHFNSKDQRVSKFKLKFLRGSRLAMFGAPPLRSAPNQYSSARARHVQTAASQRAARAAVSAIVAHLQGKKMLSERLLDTDSHTSTKSPRNPRSRPGRPVTRTAPIGAIQYQAAARSRAGVVLPVGGLACASTTGRAVLAVVRCRETPKVESAYRHGAVGVR